MVTSNVSILIEKLECMSKDPYIGDTAREAADMIRSLTSDTPVRVIKVRTTLSAINKYLEKNGYEERLMKLDSSSVNYMFYGGNSINWSVRRVSTKLSSYSFDEWIEIRNTLDNGDEFDFNL